MPRRLRICSARAKASASMKSRNGTACLLRAKPQKPQSALQAFVTDTSQTAGTRRGPSGDRAADPDAGVRSSMCSAQSCRYTGNSVEIAKESGKRQKRGKGPCQVHHGTRADCRRGLHAKVAE